MGSAFEDMLAADSGDGPFEGGLGGPRATVDGNDAATDPGARLPIFADHGTGRATGSTGIDNFAGFAGTSAGEGNDTLRGGNGADCFRFVTTGDGVDRIEDFSSATGDKMAAVAANFGLVAGDAGAGGDRARVLSVAARGR